ncbi:MAG: D-alanyl-D-alanine carboxypeptidase family protein [Actinomycetota bacterium]
MLIGALSVVLVLTLAAFSARLVDVSSDRMRAQLAADAAALAAAAEAVPYGSADPRAQALLYARHNGGELVACACEPGATSATVTVRVDGVEARARAVIDPSLLQPLAVAYDSTGLHPSLAAAVERLLMASGGTVRVVSGLRSGERQAQLWEEALRRYGRPEAADDWVAPPGHSMHELGLAVDLGGDLERAVELIRELGLPLHRPLANEPWHFELVGARSG